MEVVVIISVVILPVILSLWKVRKTHYAKTTDDFFLANKTMDSSDFVNTTVSYGYQIAALSLFASWGYFYGFWTVWVPVFWLFGFYLLQWFNNTDRLTKFFNNHNGRTLHGFLADHYKSPLLGKLAAFASILGLSGTAFFEAEFTSNVISNATFQTNTNFWFLFLFLFFVFIVLAYILYGGLKTIVITNKAQLSFGFVFFNLFMNYLFIKIIQNGFVYTGMILMVLSLLSVLVLNILYPKLNQLYPSSFLSKYSFTLSTSLIIYVVTFIYAVAFQTQTIIPLDSFSFFIKEQQFSNIFSLGGLSMVSLLLANGLWQIVDVSTWQRFAAMKDENIRKQEISKTLGFVGWYSSITWFIAILFGMGLKYTGLNISDAWTALLEFTNLLLNSNLWTDQLFVIILFFSMIFIMFSTLDSIISVISYTTYFDVVTDKQKTLKGARIWTLVYTVVFLALYYFVRLNVSTVDSILYTFYSFQLALFPAVLVMLLEKNVSKKAIISSIIFGFIGTFIPLYFNSDAINPYNSAAIFSVGFSLTALYIVNKLNSK